MVIYVKHRRGVISGSLALFVMIVLAASFFIHFTQNQPPSLGLSDTTLITGFASGPPAPGSRPKCECPHELQDGERMHDNQCDDKKYDENHCKSPGNPDDRPECLYWKDSGTEPPYPELKAATCSWEEKEKCKACKKRNGDYVLVEDKCKNQRYDSCAGKLGCKYEHEDYKKLVKPGGNPDNIELSHSLPCEPR